MTKHTYPIDISEELFLALSRGFQRIKKSAQSIIEPMGITLVEYHALRIIQNAKQISARELQKHFDSSAPTIASLVSHLETKKFIKRSKDKEDARIQHIQLTAQGQKIVNQGKKRIIHATQSMQIPTKELQNTVSSVERIISALPSPLLSSWQTL